PAGTGGSDCAREMGRLTNWTKHGCPVMNLVSSSLTWAYRVGMFVGAAILGLVALSIPDGDSALKVLFALSAAGLSVVAVFLRSVAIADCRLEIGGLVRRRQVPLERVSACLTLLRHRPPLVLLIYKPHQRKRACFVVPKRDFAGE